MGKIFCIMGKSSSGKDTLYKLILEDQRLRLSHIVPYTTRPLRAGEQDGVEYFFVGEEKLRKLALENKVIELRAYETVHGIWKYFTANDGQIDLTGHSYLMIATLESYERIRDYFGEPSVVPIYVEVEDGVRLMRALERERNEKNPRYAELCRRFLADTEDFSEEKLKAAGIGRRFINVTLSGTCEEITEYIQSKMQD
jgi:guanylate kinase